MAKAKKIKKDQLELITDQQKKLNELLRGLGILDVQQMNIHSQIKELNDEIENTKLELEKEYGKVNINLEDGSYTAIKEKDGE
tara:strand:- start:1330 stop:1578 length:249 start_codon:yes stop_codon:yes gene_type:complete